jgi:hypothetical protein
VFQLSEQAFSSAVQNLLRQIYTQRSFNNLFGNGSRRDSTMGVIANYIKNQNAFQKSAARNCQLLPAAA